MSHALYVVIDIQSFTPSGPPSVPTVSCVDLSEDINGAVNVTVNWTMSGGDSPDFYLISVLTNASQILHGGVLNVSTSNVILTGFQAGYEYNITVHGVNCGRQEGRESEPIIITPQRKYTTEHSMNSMLLFINHV